MNVLVDTSVWSLLLRRRQSARLSTRQAAAVQELKELVREDRAQLTGVIRQELLTGIRSEAEFDELRSWLRFYDDLPADFETHELAAQYANQCLGTGVVTSAIDILICAIAMKHQLPVFTLDDGFKKIQSVVPITFHVAK